MEQHITSVYLDNAATTCIDKEVVEAMLPYMYELYGNPSSTHSHGRKVKAALEQSRKSIATAINASPSEIYFTSGGTECDNMLIKGYIQTYELTHAITSPLEHHAVLHTLECLAEKGDIQLSMVDIDEKGRIDLQHLEQLLANNPRSFVSLMHGNNEIGNLINLKEVATICARHEAIFHSDTVQTMGYYPIDVKETGVHAVIGSAHKFHGPKGVGFLFMRKDAKVKPFITGGSQERNMRGGTENVAGIVGMAKALSLLTNNRNEHKAHILSLKQRMQEKLQETIPGVQFNGMSGDLEASVYKVLSVQLPQEWANEMLLFHLDLKGVSASGGSACSSGSNMGSHVLNALKGIKNGPSIRFSFSKYNTVEEVDYVVEVVKGLKQTANATVS